MLRILIICLFLVSCGGGSGGSGVGETVKAGSSVEPVSCLANKRNCSDEDVDLNAPVRWAADNLENPIVHIRWAGCSDEASSKYAFDRGVTIICVAGDDGALIIDNSPYTIVVGSDWRLSNYGPGVDYIFRTDNGSVHAGMLATALIATGKSLENHLDGEFPKHRGKVEPTILIVDNGFDSVRPLYTLYKNTALAGEVTGDFGIKGLNWLQGYIKADVIGYVPFNILPENPRIDGYRVAVPIQNTGIL